MRIRTGSPARLPAATTHKVRNTSSAVWNLPRFCVSCRPNRNHRVFCCVLVQSATSQTDVLHVADSVTSAMSSLVDDLNSGSLRNDDQAIQVTCAVVSRFVSLSLCVEPCVFVLDVSQRLLHVLGYEIFVVIVFTLYVSVYISLSIYLSLCISNLS